MSLEGLQLQQQQQFPPSPPKTVYIAIGYYSDNSEAEIIGVAYSENEAYALIGRRAADSYLGLNYRVISMGVGVKLAVSVYPKPCS